MMIVTTCYLRIPCLIKIVEQGHLIHLMQEILALSSLSESNPMMEYFRPRGKIVCVGKDLTTELQIIHEYLAPKNESRLPLLLLTPRNTPLSDICDQVVIFDSEKMLPQIYSILNSFFLIFIFNSSEEGIFNILGALLASIKFSGAIPLFIDTGAGLQPSQKEIFGECYFHHDCSVESGRLNFLILLDGIVSALTPFSGFGVTFTDLIQIFGYSQCMFYGVSSSEDLDIGIKDSIDQVGDKLVLAFPEKLEVLGTIFLSVTSKEPLSLKKMSKAANRIIDTFGREFEIKFSNSIDDRLEGFNIVLILTDINPIEKILHKSTATDFITSLIPSIALHETKTNNVDSPFADSNEEDERFTVLSRIFSESEVYIFNDGGLPLFASHRPAGQEVCLYTGLFSAIQTMSSDLIGHTPDHLTAGDKRCVFISQIGPQDSQLRGVAICSSGSEKTARESLTASMSLVNELLKNGEPEYAVNDRIQGILVKGYQNGSIDSILKATNFHAS